MVSTLTKQGADATVRALELGAVDCYAKPTGGLSDLIGTDDGVLAAKVKSAAKSRRRARMAPVAPAAPPADFSWNGRYVMIGASTGGVEALSTYVQALPANCPPTLIVQHMPAAFTTSFAARLDAQSAPRVIEATGDELLEQGTVYLAPGGDRHLVLRGDVRPRCRLVASDPVSGHCPSVDMLFRSAAQALGERAVGVILTGMGRDGADGLLAMRDAGADTVGQDEATALIYGMPRAAYEIGGVAEQLPLPRIARRVLELCAR
jgi:two-component system chemotaxis response regulator CheB